MSRTYVDNAYNRKLGRVGKPVGSCVVIKSSSESNSFTETTPKTSSATKRKEESNPDHVPGGHHPLPSSTGPHCTDNDTTMKVYVDNPLNRQLGRVGKVIGSHVLHKDGSLTAKTSSEQRPTASTVKPSPSLPLAPPPRCTLPPSSQVVTPSPRCYVDNAYNRKLGRVGKPIGTFTAHRKPPLPVTPLPVSPLSYSSSTNKDDLFINNTDSTDITSTTADELSSIFDSSLDSSLLQICHCHCIGHTAVPSRLRTRNEELMAQYTLDKLIESVRRMGFNESETYYDHYYAMDRMIRCQIEEDYNARSHKVMRPPPTTGQLIIPYADLIDIEKYPPIGKGGFGEVRIGTWKSVGLIAFKQCYNLCVDKRRLDRFLSEVEIFSTLKHPNVIQMFGAVVEKGHIGIVMEYACRSLCRALFVDEIKFTETKKKDLIAQTASALEYLHTRKPVISHGDIKSENILLDWGCNVKLCDFGLSAMKGPLDTSNTIPKGVTAGQGTPRYSAPEVLREEVLSIKELLMADVYSLTLVVYEVVTEHQPFGNLNMLGLLTYVGRGSTRPYLYSGMSPRLRVLLTNGWSYFNTLRPTMSEFCKEWAKIDRLYGYK